jgi:zinc transport system substrate-binding protein
MFYQTMRTTTVLGILIGTLSLAAVQNGRTPALSSADRIRIVTTVFPLAEFARAVAGDKGDVSLVLPPGAEVHTWQPRISDMIRIATADLFIYIGAGLEAWVHDLLKSAARPGLKTIESVRGVSLMAGDPAETHHEQERFDPHIWLDFEIDGMLIDKIRTALTEIDPANAARYERNATAFQDKLVILDHDYRDGLKSCGGRAFFYGGHAAFGYLARRYGLEQIPIYGPSPDAVPTPKELARIIDRARTMNISTVFFEPSLGDKMARLVASPLHADIRPLNPGHNVTRADIEQGVGFLDLMRTNLENLKHGLGCL